MKMFYKAKNFLRNVSQAARMMSEIKGSINTQSVMLNRKLTELIGEVKYLKGMVNGEKVSIDGFQVDGLQAPPQFAAALSNDFSHADFESVLQTHPLMFAPKTFNTSHPDYDATLARNFPGKVFNKNKDTNNPIYDELKKLMKGDEIPEKRWKAILQETLAEVKTVPHADEVFERKAYVERYLDELEARNSAFYRPGWVNLDDALFLYWVVRHLKPKVIVQTGVCNGLSSAFMMLALAKNGPDGTLHVVDMPPVYDSTDANWKVPGKVYGVTIPEGKNSGWLVPDAYRDRFEVLSGDAKVLLPGLLEKLGTCDMFYHDSDHTYDHMMFEFIEAKKYLTKSGVIVSDDISWNASLWDFADQYKVPAYNYRGSMGVACF